MGISNFLGSLNSIMGPLIVGWIVTDLVWRRAIGLLNGVIKILFYFQTDPVLWRIIFFITAGYYFVGNSLFVLFGKGTIQSWNYAPLPVGNK